MRRRRHLQKLSSAERNFLRDGLSCETRAEEQRALDLELNVPESIEDVTERVNTAVQSRMDSCRRPRRPARGHCSNRKGIEGSHGFAQRRSHALSGWFLPALSLQGLHRRPARFCSRTAGGFFTVAIRITSNTRVTISISASFGFTSARPRRSSTTCSSIPRALSLTTWSSSAATPAGPSASFRLRIWPISRDRRLPQYLATFYRREVALISYSGRSIENARRARDELFRCAKQPQGR